MKNIVFRDPHISKYSLSSDDLARLGVEDHEPIDLTWEPLEVSNALADALLAANMGFTEVTEAELDEEAKAQAKAADPTEPSTIEVTETSEPTQTGAAATGVSTATAKSRASGRNG